ncbi:MAG: hypothetical protein ACLRNQ_21955 [Flavonifractor plautii]
MNDALAFVDGLELTPRSTSSPTASSRRSRTALASSRVWGSST